MSDSENGLLIKVEDVADVADGSENVDETYSKNDETSDNNESDESDNNENESDESDESDEKSTDDENPKTLDWMKKRLAQKDRQVNKRLREKELELDELKRQIAAVYNPVDDVSKEGMIVDPVSGKYIDENSVEAQVIKKLQQVRQAESVHKERSEYNSQLKLFNDHIGTLKDKVDDYEEVIEQATPYVTQTMVGAMIASPSTVEVFYNAWKTNPDKIIEISKLRPAEQIKAMNFLEFKAQNNVKQKLKSDAPRPITPGKSSAKTLVDETSFEAILRQQRAEQKRKYGDK